MARRLFNQHKRVLAGPAAGVCTADQGVERLQWRQLPYGRPGSGQATVEAVAIWQTEEWRGYSDGSCHTADRRLERLQWRQLPYGRPRSGDATVEAVAIRQTEEWRGYSDGSCHTADQGV